MRPINWLCLFLVGASLLCGETQVSISSSANLATIGDQINLIIIVKTTEDIQSIKVSTTQKNFELVEEKEPQKRRERDYTFFEKHITIAFFMIGDFDIEPFKIELFKDSRLMETKETNSIPITVKSVLTEDDKDIKALKDPIELSGNPFYTLKYVFILLGAATIILLIFLWLKKRAQRPRREEQPLLPPLEEFETGLEKLWAQRLFEKGRIIDFFVKLTEITKRFLNRQYRFKAEDFTTYETLYNLERKEGEDLILNNMKHLFNVSDLVKFARFIPESKVSEEMWSRITDMVSVYKKREADKEKADAALRQ